jgi:hypothetical protein
MNKRVVFILAVILLLIILGFFVVSQNVGNRFHRPIPISASATTITQTPTITLTQAPIITTTSSPTITHTPLPTLTADEREDYFIGLIQNIGKCILPCWWGMTPGKTSWQEVENFVSGLGFGEFPLADEDYVDIPADIEKQQLYQSFHIRRKSDLVSNILFDAYGTYSPASMLSVWSSYSPKAILSTYGEPSRIMLHAAYGNQAVYNLLLFYDQKGILIVYGGMALLAGDNIHICPNFQTQEGIDFIRFFLQEPISQEPLENMYEAYTTLMPTPQKLEDATGLSILDFVELANSESFCFDTPFSMWH